MQRAIIKRDYMAGFAGGSTRQGGRTLIKLECGHSYWVDMSKEPKVKATCQECEGAAAYHSGQSANANPYFNSNKHDDRGVRWRTGFKAEQLKAHPAEIVEAVGERTPIEDLAATIRTLCDNAKLSQADIARQLGIPPKTLNDWLPNANRAPRTVCRHKKMLALALEALSVRLK